MNRATNQPRAEQQAIDLVLDTDPTELPATTVHRLPVRPATARSAPRTAAVDNITGHVQATVDGAGQRVLTAPSGTRTRSLVALEGGPYDRFWYRLSDWHTKQDSARAQHLRPDQPPPTVLRYRHTGVCVQNPNGAGGWGELWRYHPPLAALGRGPEVLTLPDGERAVVCPKCECLAPKLITARLAHLTEPDQRCPRCAYPTQRYLGAVVETMPAVYQQWYAAHPTTDLTPPTARIALDSGPRHDVRDPCRLNQEGTAA